MKTDTLHVPGDAMPGDPDALQRAVLVKDGFSWGAFIFSFFWFFAHRLWVAGLIVLVAALSLGFLMQALRVGAGGTFLAELLLALLVGLEASSLRRWTLARRSRPAVDVVAARDREEAETKTFARWLGETSSARSPERHSLRPSQPGSALFARAEPVIGLFPEAERGR